MKWGAGALIVLLVVTGTTSLSAQRLPSGRVGAQQAKVYRVSPDSGRGAWKVERVTVADDGLVVGQQRILYGRITEAIYDQRQGGFRGLLRKREIRHVLTVRFTDDTHRRQSVVIELGKDIAEVTANRLAVIGGVDVTLTES